MLLGPGPSRQYVPIKSLLKIQVNRSWAKNAKLGHTQAMNIKRDQIKFTSNQQHVSETNKKTQAARQNRNTYAG